MFLTKHIGKLGVHVHHFQGTGLKQGTTETMRALELGLTEECCFQFFQTESYFIY